MSNFLIFFSILSKMISFAGICFYVRGLLVASVSLVILPPCIPPTDYFSSCPVASGLLRLARCVHSYVSTRFCAASFTVNVAFHAHEDADSQFARGFVKKQLFRLLIEARRKCSVDVDPLMLHWDSVWRHSSKL